MLRFPPYGRLHVGDCPKTNNTAVALCVCERYFDEPRLYPEGSGGLRAAPRSKRLDRAVLGDLAARYCTKAYNRHDARRWMRRFRRLVVVASDALQVERRTAAIETLCDMVGLEDAIRLTAEPQPALSPTPILSQWLRNDVQPVEPLFDPERGGWS